MIKVSVIVPVYKVEKYLKRCVNSLLNQDYSDYEIILVDDGSPDGCPQICDDYEREKNRITVVHKENGGLSDARNIGVKYAKGDYIVFVDSDDYVNRNHISSLFSLVEKYDADIVCSPPIVEYERNDNSDYNISNTCNEKKLFEDYVVSAKDAQAMILRGRPVGTSAWSKLYRKEYCERYPFPKGKVMEELATTFHLVGAAQKIAVSGVPSYHYVQRKGSILHSDFTMDEIIEYMSLAESYVVNATSSDMKHAAAERVFLLGRRLGCAAPSSQKKQAYSVINRYCKKNSRMCLTDKKMYIREKIRVLFMCISPATLKMYIVVLQHKENRKWRNY